MNEIIFLLHAFLILAFSLFSLRLGSSALIASIALQAVLANLFVVKQTLLFGMEVTCSDVFAVGSLLSLNLLQEFYGPQEVKKGIKVSLYSVLFFALMSQFHLWYGPSPSDVSHPSFASIFSSTPRIALASIGVYFLAQQVDVRIFGYLKRRPLGLAFRIGLSLLVSQAIDTVLFSFFGLYGIVSSLRDIILVSLLVKWIAIASCSPWTAFARRVARTA
jgi:uncharacterized integral membrane protein (TIGR00697 family)